MLDRWPLQTLVLATFTAWALLLAVAAGLGLGARVTPHPDDGALAPPLPEIGSRQAEVELDAFASFTEVVDRPLFSPDRRPQAVQLADNAPEEASIGNLELTSVVITPELRMASLRDTDANTTLRVREGAPIEGRPGWRLLSLGPRTATLEGPSGSHSLDLRVFDGKGGESPTRVVDAPPAPSASPAQPEAAPQPTGNTEFATINARERAEQIRQRIEARRAELREQAARRQEAQEQ